VNAEWRLETTGMGPDAPEADQLYDDTWLDLDPTSGRYWRADTPNRRPRSDWTPPA
jgi:hypothetical protein